MLEFYQAYANYHDLMKLSEELIIFIAKQVNGSCITHFNGHEIDLGKWTKLSMREAIIKFWPKEFHPAPTQVDFDNARRFNHFVETFELPTHQSLEDSSLRNLYSAFMDARATAKRPNENVGK